MVNIPTKKAENFEKPLIRSGEHQGALVSITLGGEKTFPGKNGKPDNKATRICLNFLIQTKIKVADDKFQMKDVIVPFIGFGEASEGNKLGKALRALGYTEPFEGKEIDESKLIGKSARLVAETFSKQDKPDEKYSIITKVLPFATDEFI